MMTTPAAEDDGRPHVGWIGAGRMGQALVTRLLENGHRVDVWNRSPDKLDPLVARGARAVTTAQDAALAPVVFSMVLDDGALDDLCAAAEGPLGPRARATAWIDCSTVSPAAAARARIAARARGIAFATAPVSGNPGVVAAGNAVFALSGDAAAVTAARPVLQVLGRAVHELGEGEQANVVKLCTNAVLGVLMQTLAEVCVLGQRAGVRRSDLLAFINDSAVGSPFSRYKTAALVDLDLTPTFTPAGQRKDIRLALALADQVQVPMPVLSGTEVEFSRLVASGRGAGKDFAALILQVAADAGMDIAPEVTRG